eukprot:CAMPEP_0206139850 /NCGR_PEP_ID=MMETSP1473-20131121/7550_1 /ASSEMBLY_ACC=CAM_ASM_001109 /TAXON_ID=1461547 /ORGANISM="Stichococcus sp, Strain RCC1054" /LENGTH=865 /DNA_ID=CAMNT_0053533773 /DNA_START=333 /DNA_END=2930 /DNA_ORIENTATION=-
MSVKSDIPLDQQALKLADSDDRHWAANETPARGKRLPKGIQKAYNHSQYESKYLTMRDGIRIAIDVMRPPWGTFDETKGLPCILLQTRYQRGSVARWPISKLLNGRPVDLLGQEAKSWFLAAGYAVCCIDVRGTGASFGRWRAPWTPEERADSREVVDWISHQPWCNGQVCLYGVSYDGTIALFTTAEQHPAVKAAAPQYAFWDLYGDIALPGGIALHSFVGTWTQHCLAMDTNDLSKLPFPNGIVVPMLISGAMPVVEGQKMGHHKHSSSSSSSSSSDDKGSTPAAKPSANEANSTAQAVQATSKGRTVGNGAHSNGSTGGLAKKPQRQQQHQVAPVKLSKKDLHAAQAAGHEALRTAVAGHDSWAASEDLGEVRCIDEIAPRACLKITDISACSAAAAIAASGVPLLLTAGWLDSTAGPAICMFTHAAKTPGSRLMLGPWGHGGNMYVRLSDSGATRSAFSQPLECIRFFDKACGYSPVGRREKHFGAIAGGFAAARASGNHKRAGNQPADSLFSPSANSASTAPNNTSGSASTWTASAQAVSGQDGSATSGSSVVANGSSSMQIAQRIINGEAKSEKQGEEAPVRYFVMGCRPRWKATHSWPPHDLAHQPLKLFFDRPNDLDIAGNATTTSWSAADGGAGGLVDMPIKSKGSLTGATPAETLRWQQEVDQAKYLKGKSRYDVITQPTKVIQYHKLRSAGHTLFTGEPLREELEMVGWVTVDVWVASSDTEADVFVYLQDFDPASDKAKYVTEGQFRASHRKELPEPPAGDPRAAAHLPGMPFHSFSSKDRQPLEPGVPVRVRFQLLPTAYAFPPGHCVRIAVAGADGKHFSSDHEGPRTLYMLSGGDMPSQVSLPIVDPGLT